MVETPLTQYATMEYDITTYFKEHEEDAVKGFTIIDDTDDGYQIAEKWLKTSDGGGPETESKWIQYDVPAEQLEGRVESDKCEPVGQLTERQFEAVCENLGMEGVSPKELLA